MLDIKVLTLANGSLVPKIMDTSVYVSGLPLLIQHIVKCLLTEPGQDRFDPDFGAGIRTALPTLYNPSQMDRVKMLATEAILKCEKQLKEDDSTVNTPAEERLDSLHLRNVEFDPNGPGWVLGLTLKTVDQKVASFVART